MEAFATLNRLQTLAQMHENEPFKVLVIQSLAEQAVDVNEACIDWLTELLA